MANPRLQGDDTLKNLQGCPVCDRAIRADNPSKGDRIYEEQYCSHYCRIFEERGLKKIRKSDNKYHSGMFRWPKIHIPCQMCAEPTLLIHDIEKGNRQFCSTTCHHLFKGARKRHMDMGHLLLSILKHKATYSPKTSWMKAHLIAEYMGRTTQQITPYRVSSMLKRWIACGLVEYKNLEYRFNLKKLGKTPLAKAMYDWITLPYAERMKL